MSEFFYFNFLDFLFQFLHVCYIRVKFRRNVSMFRNHSVNSAEVCTIPSSATTAWVCEGILLCPLHTPSRVAISVRSGRPRCLWHFDASSEQRTVSGDCLCQAVMSCLIVLSLFVPTSSRQQRSRCRRCRLSTSRGVSRNRFRNSPDLTLQ